MVVPDHPHHVIMRGNNRRRLFSYPREHQFFLARLHESSQKFGVPVHANAQMSNHVHLIVTAEEARQLSRFVSLVAQTFAQFRNKSRRGSGKLFEERYKCYPITNEQYMAVATVYVDLNPVLGGVCERADDYRWSTFALHAGAQAREPLLNQLWAPSPWYLSLGSTTAARARAYLDWFEHYRARDRWSEIGDKRATPSGRERFERPDRRSAL